MTQWEYRVIYHDPMSSVDEYQTKLNGYGAEGWRVVDIHRPGHLYAWEILLMREKVNEP